MSLEKRLEEDNIKEARDSIEDIIKAMDEWAKDEYTFPSRLYILLCMNKFARKWGEKGDIIEEE